MPARKTAKKEDSLQALHKSGTLLMMTGSVFLVLIMVCMIVGFVTMFNGGLRGGAKTITVTGTGEAFAMPDIATFWVNLQEEGDDVASAQQALNERTDEIVSALEAEGIAESDIQTASYNAYPRYEYQQQAVICPAGIDCPPGDRERVLVGYEVSQRLRVVIRDIDEAGSIVGVFGSLNVDNINGPSFEIEDETAAQEEARSEAIADAKMKAQKLAKDLGVRLGKVVSFNEGGNYGEPMPYATRMLSMDAAADVMEESIAPSLPAGENEVQTTVNITYKIK